MSFKKGDFIEAVGNKIGEVVDINEDGNLEVYFLVPNSKKANGKIYEYAEEWELVCKNDVVKHIDKPVDKFDYPKLYMSLGFRPMDGDIFIKADANIEEDEDLKSYEFPTNCIELEEEDADEYDYTDGFVIKDEDGEAFTPASPTNDFVIDTHKAVHGYNDWTPNKNDKNQVGIKRFIDDQEKKAIHKEDDRQFALGKSIDYNHPPLKRVKSTTS